MRISDWSSDVCSSDLGQRMTLADIQRRVGVTPDGIWGPNTAAAVAKALDGQPDASSELVALATKHLNREEGRIPHAYQDSLGYWTIGVGRLIDKRKGGRLTNVEIDMLLANDIADKIAEISDWPAWQAVKADPVRATALLSMAFQMGAAGLAGLKDSLKLVEQKRWGEAAANMLASKWAKRTPERAGRVTKLNKKGAY